MFEIKYVKNFNKQITNLYKKDSYVKPLHFDNLDEFEDFPFHAFLIKEVELP